MANLKTYNFDDCEIIHAPTLVSILKIKMIHLYNKWHKGFCLTGIDVVHSNGTRKVVCTHRFKLNGMCEYNVWDIKRLSNGKYFIDSNIFTDYVNEVAVKEINDLLILIVNVTLNEESI